ELTASDPDIIPGSTQWRISTVSEGVIDSINADVLQYTYPAPGYYIIGVISLLTGFPYNAVDCGHADITVDTVRAVADFKSEGHCINANILFEDLTTFLPGETISAWNWNFGDAASGADNTSALQDPQHIFATAGDYIVTLTVQMLSGCQTSRSKQVHISDGPVLNPTFDPIYCEDEALAVSLPGQVFDVSWDFGDPSSGTLNNATSTPAFHAYDVPAFYTGMVTAADVFGCISSAYFGPDIRPNLLTGLIDVSPIGILCYGDTATLTSPPVGVSWLWSTDETTSQIEVTESNPYTVLIEDVFHCKYTPPPATVIINPLPDLIIQGREILGNGEYGPWQSELHICQGTEFELEAFSSSPPAFYHWSDGYFSKVISFTDEGGNLPAAGLYEWSLYISAGGCLSDTASFTVEIFGLPQFPFIAKTGGSGCSFDVNTLQVMNVEAGVDYYWSDGQQGASIQVQNAGNYFVTAVNAQGCSVKSSSITIQPSAPVDQIPGGCHIACDPLTVCLPPLQNISTWTIYQNGNVFQTGTTWPGNYLITTDGSYTIEVTTINGCVATSDPLDISLYTGVGSITVLTYEDIDHDSMITAADVLIGGIPVQIISDDGTQAGMTYTWATGGFVFEDYPAIGYTAFFNPLLLPSQWKIVIDSVSTFVTTCGDSVVVSLLLTQNCTVAGPDLMIESCPGDDVMVGDSIWSDTGQYILHLPSAGGCDSVVNVNILWPDSIQIGATVWVDVDQNSVLSPADTVIQGITVVLDHLINQGPIINVTDINGNVNGTYDAGPYIINVDSTILPPSLELIYGFDFVADTVCGMVHFDFLLAPGCADVFMIEQEEFCEGDSVLIQGEWISQSGVYSYLLSLPGSGCDTTLDVYVTVLPGPSIESTSDWNCIQQGTIEISVSGIMPYQFLWNPALPGDTLFTGLQEGVYDVTVTDANGCETADSIIVPAATQLGFDLPNQYEIHAGDSVDIDITGSINEPGLTYQWSPPLFLSCATCPTPWAFPDSSTLYSVLITDADSCTYALETWVIVTFDSSNFDQLYIPNVFSPNGDGVNDYWRPYSRLINAHINSLTLFDRWGEMLFHKEDYDINSFEGWDGTFRGNKMQPAVFVYVADITLGDGTHLQRKGNVTLIR
ncbi:MAG TPA: gliding motility-associated C-terminal domain-containing protein, partial [Saprospiraceae bacterium]|nr:gliding motility-associated C-terminal domain-containing protein [Saprospiraceae bacterium]